MEEHDLIVTVKDIPNVPKNTRGTIVHIYNETTFEGEFVVNGTNFVETIKDTDIIKTKN